MRSHDADGVLHPEGLQPLGIPSMIGATSFRETRRLAMLLSLEPAAGGPAVPLDKAVLFFGRHPDCDVRLMGSPKVSRRHCCIAQVNDRWVVRDLGSMNGVTLNGEQVEREADLKLGDELAVGDVVYKVVDGQQRKK